MSANVSERVGEMIGYLRLFAAGKHIAKPVSIAPLWRDLADAAREIVPEVVEHADTESEVALLRETVAVAEEGIQLEDRLFRAGQPSSMRHVRRERERHARRVARIHARWEPPTPQA